MRIIKMESVGHCEVMQEPSRTICQMSTDFMTDENGGASMRICIDHIRESRKPHGGY